MIRCNGASMKEIEMEKFKDVKIMSEEPLTDDEIKYIRYMINRDIEEKQLEENQMGGGLY